MGDFLIFDQFFQPQYFNIHIHIRGGIQQQCHRQIVYHNHGACHWIYQQQYRQRNQHQ